MVKGKKQQLWQNFHLHLQGKGSPRRVRNGDKPSQRRIISSEPMPYLVPQYEPTTVILSLLIGCFASYVTLELAKRMRSPDKALARFWWFGGALTMGTGIWSMHFVGMFAFSLPIELGYRGLQTLLSWVAAVVVSAIALRAANLGQLSQPRLIVSALLMGTGICAMHYTGMAALDMAPGIVWNAWLVAASALIAVAASAVALLIFFWLRKVNSRHLWAYQLVAAGVMGVAITGMHYTGMAAAQFPADSICRSADALAGRDLGVFVILGTLMLLSMTMITSILDARMQGKASRLSDRLQSTNAELEKANQELQHHAFTDALTGLPNRLLLEDRLRHAVSRFERQDKHTLASRNLQRIAVLFVDLDGFKPINDTFGHATGDKVLKEVAQRLLRCARDADTVARLGGDEFVLLLEDLANAADAVALAQRVIDTFSAPFQIDGNALQLGTSIGIALCPDHAQSEKLLVHADAAMYAAKRMGGRNYALFEAHMDASNHGEISLHADLSQALARGEISLHYQPKVESRCGKIRGVEALLRWQHPQRGAVGPQVFIPIAERYGLINALGDWVINEACRQMQAWQSTGLTISVAINLSVHQLRQESLGERIAAALARHAIRPERLLCEITESVAMEDIRATQTAFDALSRLGVLLSIDDFGTGYSSLSYLRQLPAKQLKIDRSFILDIDDSADARAIVDAVIKLAHALGLSVVAEGVETEAQRDILLGLDCDEMQGYLFAKPMTPAALMAMATEPTGSGVTGFSPSALG
jgi:diguanylate cyclase (GGDEF)-like protein